MRKREQKTIGENDPFLGSGISADGKRFFFKKKGSKVLVFLVLLLLLAMLSRGLHYGGGFGQIGWGLRFVFPDGCCLTDNGGFNGLVEK